MAFGAVDGDGLMGVSRLAEDPEGETAEFAILVRTDRQMLGLGERLMGDLIDYARDRGIGTLSGTVLTENRRMLALCEKLGFMRRPIPGAPGLAVVTLHPAGPPGGAPHAPPHRAT